VFLVGLALNITFALGMAFFRATMLDLSSVVLCVAMMSISGLNYIIGGSTTVQALAPGADLGLRGGVDASSSSSRR
jgi:peptide/nickel transport system permease protein